MAAEEMVDRNAHAGAGAARRPAKRAAWAQYRLRCDEASRDRVVAAHGNLVSDALSRAGASGLTGDELSVVERYAWDGLCDAVDRYPDTRAAADFAAFAEVRVAAAVRDALQRLQLAPLTLYRRPVRCAPAGGRSDGVSRDGHGRSPGRGEAPPERSTAAQRAEEFRLPYRGLVRAIGLAPEPPAIGTDPADRVRRAMRRLPEQQRTVLTLQYLAGLDLEQVGSLLGSGVIGARRASEVALDALRLAVEDDGGLPLVAAQAG